MVSSQTQGTDISLIKKSNLYARKFIRADNGMNHASIKLDNYMNSSMQKTPEKYALDMRYNIKQSHAKSNLNNKYTSNKITEILKNKTNYIKPNTCSPKIKVNRIDLPNYPFYNNCEKLLESLRALSPAGPTKRYFWSKNETNDKLLGSGYTSSVYKGIDRFTGKSVAIKFVKKEKQLLLATDNYYRTLYARLPKYLHPNLLKIHDFYDDTDNFYIVSELCTGPDLVDYILEFKPRTVPIAKIKSIMLSIFLAIAHLHKNNLVHRDIKLDNILFKDSTRRDISIVDFDMMLMIDKDEPPRPPKSPEEISIVGTKDYMAPEGYKGVYSKTSDLWSAGVILFIFLDGHFPFNLSDAVGGQNICKVLQQGINIDPEIKFKNPLAVDLVQKLLTYNINKRMTSVFDVLQHPWFTIDLKQNRLNLPLKFNVKIPSERNDKQEQNNYLSLHDKNQNLRSFPKMNTEQIVFHSKLLRYNTISRQLVPQNCTNKENFLARYQFKKNTIRLEPPMINSRIFNSFNLTQKKNIFFQSKETSLDGSTLASSCEASP